MGDFRFTSEQRDQLAGFGVSQKQIEMLEGHACLVGSAQRCKSPRRTVVSKKIEALRKHLRAAHVVLEKILAANEPGYRDAERYLGQAVCRSGKEVKLLDPAGLEALACICDEALAMLPIQTWHRDADPRIVQWIHEDLIQGHSAEHYILDDGADWSAAGPETPPFTIKPSSSSESRFRDIVRVCYEAMGYAIPDADHHRAIKKFIKQRNAQMAEEAQAAAAEQQLLGDIRVVFKDRGVDRISAQDLALALVALEQRRWAGYSRGKPLTKAKLARLLRSYGVVWRSVRLPDGRTPKGYLLEQFAGHGAKDRHRT
jgi:uncharacterized protein DUF3631